MKKKRGFKKNKEEEKNWPRTNFANYETSGDSQLVYHDDGRFTVIHILHNHLESLRMCS